MTTPPSHTGLSARRWLKAVTLLMGVLVGLTFAVSNVCAMESSEAGHSCCCDHDGPEAEESSDEQTVASETPCKMSAPGEGCACHIDSDDATPKGDVLALGSGSYSFAPAAAAVLHPQIHIPLARAPSQVPSHWLYGQPPPDHLYILHQTFLI